MLAMSVRVSPCSSRACLPSSGRSTRSAPSSRTSVSCGAMSRLRSPLGPLTDTWVPSTVTSTPGGTVMGSLPMRDMGDLPDVRQDLATQLALAGLLTGHDPLAGADDDQAQAAEDPWDIGLRRIDPE